MKTVILIPARYGSRRFPGKPLVHLRQKDGTSRSLIAMSWAAASEVPGVTEIHVATDDERIREHCATFGASVIMTSPAAENGTARCAEALANSGIDADLVINFQGDAPLTPPWFVEALISSMAADDSAQVATPVLQCDRATYDMFVEDRKAGRVGGTTAVFGAGNRALYFSKEIVPFIDPQEVPQRDIPVYHHVGVYAYRPGALRDYVSWGESRLERLEGLEQLRFLVHGAGVRCVEVDARGRRFWELNNPQDVTRIEEVLRDG